MRNFTFLLTTFFLLGCLDAKDNDNEGVIKQNAKFISCYYYGGKQSEDIGTVSYEITFSDQAITNNSQFRWKYTLGLYVTDGSLENIPVGTYTLDTKNIYTDKTILADKSKKVTDDGYTYNFISATLEVSESQMTLTATTDDGKEYEVTYAGDYEIIDGRAPEDDTADEGVRTEDYGNYTSNLKEDVKVVLDNILEITASYYGDDYNKGYNVLTFYFENSNTTGNVLWLEIAVEDTDFVGTYSTCASWNDAGIGNLISANIFTYNESVNYCGCWYFTSSDGKTFKDIAPIVTGSLTITEGDNDKYIFAFEGSDAKENGHKITFNWTGKIDLVDNTK